MATISWTPFVTTALLSLNIFKMPSEHALYKVLHVVFPQF